MWPWYLIWWFASLEKVWSYITLNVLTETRCHYTTQTKPNSIGSQNHTINRAAFVCLSVCLFVPYLLRGPLTDLRQIWCLYVAGPRNCPWGVLFRKGQRLDGSTGHFHFPLYYICTSLMPHAATAPLACSSKSLIRHLLLDGYCTASQQCI